MPIWKTLPFLKGFKDFFPEWIPKTVKVKDLKRKKTRKLMAIASASAIEAY